jgi:serine/threonine protein kinase/tetratricopeptide (TPR) repeat protein
MSDETGRLTGGHLLDRYRIVSRIGAGGMGEVYLADDLRLRRKVAIKVLPGSVAGDPDRLLRFEREAYAASALNHPNIVTIYEFGKADERHYLASEYVVGETLRRRLDRSRPSLREAIDVALQVAAALRAAHEAGIVHRDIKPENLMVREDGYVKVLDFGLAKVVEGGPAGEEAATLAHHRTGEGTILGTVAYMSPEQARGSHLDGSTDLWSLGCVLYEMLTGGSPFAGRTTTDVLANIIHREPAPLRSLAPAAPAALERVVSRTLSKERASRHGSAGELIAELRDVQRRLDSEPGADTQPTPRTDSAPREVRAGSAAAGPRTPTTDGRARDSIAVLPFANISRDEENEHFCDGLAEELLNALAKIERLKVAARTSAFSFKGKDATVSAIGRALGVQTVLEGSVRRAGNRVRITVQLIDATDGYHIWSERYDREMSDIFAVQDEITLAVVAALKVKLFGGEQAAALQHGTADPDAYQAYLKGRFFWSQRTAASLRQAVAFYEQALAADPGYALAWAGLAECYVLFGWLSVESPHASMPKAEAAARRALELDGSLAEAHAALGVYLSFYAWDQPASVKALRRALELKPGHATACHWLGNIPLLALGEFDESIAAVRRAGEMDPLSPIISSDLGLSLLCARRFDEAVAQFQATLTMDPFFYVARYHLGQAYDARGEHVAAIAEYERCLATGTDPWVEALLGRSLARRGRRAEAVRWRDRLLAESGTGYVPYVGLAVLHAALGELGEAFAWLEKDLADRSLWPPFYGVDPVFDDLRADPRFADVLRRVVPLVGAAS